MSRRLYDAALDGDLERVSELLDQGHDVNKINHREATPLHAAALSGDINMVRFLVDRGADLEARDHSGDTQIMFCCCFDFRIFEFLLSLSRGADAMTRDSNGGTLLHWILIHDRGPTWMRLLFHHINGDPRMVLSMKDFDGSTPLHLAMRVDSARCLVENGFDPSSASVFQSTWMCPSVLFIPSNEGQTPLEESEEWRNKELAKYLASFESLSLVDPATMKLSAGLDLFQRFLARRVYYTALCKIPTGHNVSLCIMAFLCPADVMK